MAARVTDHRPKDQMPFECHHKRPSKFFHDRHGSIISLQSAYTEQITLKPGYSLKGSQGHPAGAAQHWTGRPCQSRGHGGTRLPSPAQLLAQPLGAHRSRSRNPWPHRARCILSVAIRQGGEYNLPPQITRVVRPLLTNCRHGFGRDRLENQHIHALGDQIRDVHQWIAREIISQRTNKQA